MALSPMTSVLVVARSKPGIAELSHVTGTLSAFLDCSSTLPLAKACAMGSTPLLQRIWELSKTPETAIDAWCLPTNTWCPSRLLWTNQFYYQDQFAKGTIAACKGGHLSNVRWLLDHFVGCVAPVEAVEAAAQQGQRDILELLLDIHNEYKKLTRPGARMPINKPHQVKFWESNALLAAAIEGHGDLVIWMYKNVFNSFYMHSNQEIIDQLARHGDFDSVMRLVAENWQPPRLDFAAEGGDVAMMQWLLDQKLFAGGRTALKAAAANGHLEIVKMLVNEDLGFLDGDAFCSAAENGHFKVVQWLKQQNLGWTSASRAIDLAARNGHLDIVQYLYSECRARCTPATMHEAVSNGHLDVVQWLYEQFANDPVVDLFEEFGSRKNLHTTMDAAAANGHLHVLEFLHSIGLSSGSPSSARFKNLPTCTSAAIQLAAAGGHVDVMQWLRVHYWTEPTTDAMDVAAANGHFEMVKWLHENASVGCSTAAMDGAARGGHLAIMEWLHENRAEGCTTNAMDEAATMGLLDVVQWLYGNRAEGSSAKAIEGAASNDHFDVVLFLASKYSKIRRAGREFVANQFINTWLVEKYRVN